MNPMFGASVRPRLDDPLVAYDNLWFESGILRPEPPTLPTTTTAVPASAAPQPVLSSARAPSNEATVAPAVPPRTTVPSAAPPTALVAGVPEVDVTDSGQAALTGDAPANARRSTVVDAPLAQQAGPSGTEAGEDEDEEDDAAVVAVLRGLTSNSGPCHTSRTFLRGMLFYGISVI